MSEQHRDMLRQITSFPALVRYLRDELDWPIEAEDFDDLTFEYEPDELGIDRKTAAKIEYIKQLRPLADEQPWGIFFVKFEPKRLPVVAMRRILRGLAVKKRASANRAERAAWNKSDLLFISAYGEDEQRHISFAHFHEDDETSSLPVLRVLGWDGADTALHIDHVHDTLTSQLRWPDAGADLDAWRERWSSAFTLRHREVITTSKQMAVRLADLARQIRRKVNAILTVETDDGPMRKMMKAFREALVHDLEDDDFADMYAQTIAYGLLTARISRPADLATQNLTDMVPVTNPFLKELLQTFLDLGGRHDVLDFDELGISEVVETLRLANMEAVLRDFGDRNPDEDPVVHFYELFLKEYDARKRMQRGVFYTPRPVVSYIVRSVHELLQTEFGLEDGLADTTTWGEMLKKHPDMKLPTIKVKKPDSPDLIDQPIDPSTPFVVILDPACGTGTFLVEVIDVIYRTMKDKWRKAGKTELYDIPQLWNDYVREHLLPRLYGYELMMAPYAIAHMKIGLKLYETRYKFGAEQRARIYLTNSLEPPQDFSDRLEFMAPALAHEAQAVNDVKRNQRFTVVVGNPPYLGEAGTGGEWIAGLMRGKDTATGRKTASYFEVDGNPLKERNCKWMNDDYVKFIRLSHFLLDTTGCGVHGYISNHGYLDNPTFRGIRWALMHSFHAIHALDLHGNLKKKETPPDGGKDINVFDIEQGVGIGLFAKSGPRTHPVSDATVRHADLWGERREKYDWLASHSFSNTGWASVGAAEPFYLFEPFESSEVGDYFDWPAVNDAMPLNGTGIITKRDFLAIHMSREEVWQTVTDFAGLPEDEARSRFRLPPDVRDWQFNWAQRDVANSGPSRECIQPILYRPFDTRYVYYTGQTRGFIGWPVVKVMGHMLAGENLAIGTTRTVEIGSGYSHIFATREMIQHHTISIKEVNYEFPLYLYPGVGRPDASMFDTWPEGKCGRRPNLDQGFVKGLEQASGLTFESDGRGDLTESFGPEDVLAYIYAVFHSPEYRRRFEPMLKLDFPRVPPPGGLEPFAALARLGHDLLALHLLESPMLDKPITRYIGPADAEVEKVSYAAEDQTVWLDKAQTRGFRPVPEDVWNFHIGGYQVCHKWLKDRQAKGGKHPRPGRVLTAEDIEHYCKIVTAIHHTIRIMGEIDETIDAHGGWPDAFITDPEEIKKLKSGSRSRDAP
ncbi:MAG: type ISP restriction/modification enzyme [bacterium]